MFQPQGLCVISLLERLFSQKPSGLLLQLLGVCSNVIFVRHFLTTLLKNTSACLPACLPNPFNPFLPLPLLYFSSQNLPPPDIPHYQHLSVFGVFYYPCLTSKIVSSMRAGIYLLCSVLILSACNKICSPLYKNASNLFNALC